MLNRISRIFAALALVAAFGGPPAFAQINTLTATTLSAAIANGQSTLVTLASCTNVNAPNLQSSTIGSELYIVAPGQVRGEVMLVQTIPQTSPCNVNVRRTSGGAGTGFPSGSMVLVGQPNWFYDVDPTGGCTAATTWVTPYVNTRNGYQWLCSTITLSWVPGWQNPSAVIGNGQVTAAVASVAGATAINGPLQHITGTNDMTSFTMSVGWNGGGFCVIPDAIFSTTAGNNIGLGSTGVVKKTLCYTWDATNSWFDPSY